MIVFCSGMKRSGSTWQYNAVCRILATAGRVEAVGFLADDELEVRRSELLNWARNPDTLFVVKTHAIAELLFPGLADGAIRTTYTCRDIRDVAASAKKQFRASGPRLITILDEALEAYAQVAGLSGALLQRYESFTCDPQAAVEELARYFDVPLSKEACTEIVEACSVKTMKRIADDTSASLRKRLFKAFWHLSRRLPIKPLLLKCGFPLPLWIRIRNRVRPYDNETLLRPGHVSESGGAPGQWRHTLTPEEIQTIDTRYASWLRAYYGGTEPLELVNPVRNLPQP